MPASETEIDNLGTVKGIHIEEEVQQSYLDYAMSVIVSRALPDVRDGLKPVHRRVLYAMHTINLTSSAKYQKSAAVVGQVMKDFHPHGDSAIYDTLVRMAQDFSMRYTLVDGQGNFGSVDGDSAAAMRYTECRMDKISSEMLQDIDKETVEWTDNYDGRLKEPTVLPAKIPQLLLNGSIGIAVGMATAIPPHNLGELCDGLIYQIDHPDLDVDDLLRYVKGPDFPTAGIIYDIEEIRAAYATGKGKIVMRARAQIENDKKGSRIVVSEIPYQVNKSVLVSRIADLVKEKKLDGISDLRDESDRDGIRIVIELKSNAYPNKVLNQLYEHTTMQTAFHVNMLALTPELEPRILTLKEIFDYFIHHRIEIVTRRLQFELARAKDRAHILEGLKIALDHLDEVISTIRQSKDREDAKGKLIKLFSLSDRQADAILEMRLAQLAALERQKIEDEYQDILALIAKIEDILSHQDKILAIIKDELKEIKNKFGDQRKTEVIAQGLGKFSAEDLIPEETMIISLTKDNYIKRVPASTYRNQIRGGKGVIGMTTKEEDQVEHLLTASTHDDILFFTNRGRVFQTKVYELPQSSRQAKGQALVNIIQIAQDELVTGLICLHKNSRRDFQYFIFATIAGQIKKTSVEQFTNVRKTGLIAITLSKNDELRWVKTSSGKDKIIEVTAQGQAIYFDEEDVRAMGRTASGVRAIKLRANDRVIAMNVVGEKQPQADLLIVLENGFGKRTQINNFTLQQRGGIGMRAAHCSGKTGPVIGAYIVMGEHFDVLIMSKQGQVLRLSLTGVKRLGRDTQGVTLIRMASGDRVASVTLLLPEEIEVPNEPYKVNNYQKG